MAEFQIPSEEYVFVEYSVYVDDNKRNVLLQVGSDSVYLSPKEARKVAEALVDSAAESVAVSK